VKTRTLLLLAVACGTAILIAGALLFVKLLGQDDPPVPVPVGVVATAGDLRATVQSFEEVDGRFEVVVTIGGVDDDDGVGAFELVTAGGKSLSDPSSNGDPPACRELTVADQRCSLSFPLPPQPGTTRILRVERGGELVLWDLVTT